MTGEMELFENYTGKVNNKQCDRQRYLGFIISNSGNSLFNIYALRKKSIGINCSIFTKCNALKVQNYYFE